MAAASGPQAYQRFCQLRNGSANSTPNAKNGKKENTRPRSNGQLTQPPNRPMAMAAAIPTVLASRPRRWMARSKGTVSIQNMRAYKYHMCRHGSSTFCSQPP